MAKKNRSKKKPQQREYKTPSGTIALMVIFIILLVTLWGSVYLTMLSRGATY